MTESAATNGVGSRVAAELDDATVAGFKDNLDGEVLVPDDLAYDGARMIWNRLIDKRPALIARCATADDVVRSVRFAREHDLAVAVRGGGHNIAGNCVCDGGLMIDLSPMKGIQVDPQRRTARAQPGLTLGEFDRHTQAHGLATTMGIASEVGIAGLTLGGGYGWLAGRYGLACDNLVSVALVTAEGKHVSASEGENAELFWGVRGGGANFGVITSFEYRLHTVGKVLGGMVLYAPTRDALRFFDEFSSSCPDEVSTMGLLTTAPDGNLAFAIVACHCGPIDEGEKALTPLRNFGPPLADMLEPRDYTDMQSMTDEAWPRAASTTGRRASCARSATRRSTYSWSTRPASPPRCRSLACNSCTAPLRARTLPGRPSPTASTTTTAPQCSKPRTTPTWSRAQHGRGSAMRRCVPSPSAPPTSTTSARSASVCRKRTGRAWSDCAR